jgi:hypothetical protein
MPWIFAAFGIIAAFFLMTEHRAHLFGVLPYLLLLACPLLHVLSHGRHGGHGGRHAALQRRTEEEAP